MRGTGPVRRDAEGRRDELVGREPWVGDVGRPGRADGGEPPFAFGPRQ
ncbi:hypothetical protein OZK63_02095 [Streptomyces sp. UMAF16]|nr:hypothetical protein [Streptomyces sp. UMAF16]